MKQPLLYALLATLLIAQVVSYSYNVQSASLCMELSGKECTLWRTLTTFTSFGPACFPATAVVMGRKGPITMAQLKVGDQILAYDSETHKNVFTKVTAWLHRVTDAAYEYKKVIGDTVSFHTSARHNVAVRIEGAIGYVFGKDLKGHELVLAADQDLVVDSIQTQILNGIYAPYTANSNFYIFAENQNKFHKLDNYLVLVHSFAEISEPIRYESAFAVAVKAAGLLGQNRQPSDREQYVHPLSNVFAAMFPPFVKHLIPTHQGTYYSRNYYYSNTDEAERERRRRRKQAVLLTTWQMMSQLVVK